MKGSARSSANVAADSDGSAATITGGTITASGSAAAAGGGRIATENKRVQLQRGQAKRTLHALLKEKPLLDLAGDNLASVEDAEVFDAILALINQLGVADKSQKEDPP